jgi:Flp pilus assembly protein TadG
LQGRAGAGTVEFTLGEMSMNVVHVVRGAVKGALVAWTSANSRRLLVRVLRDEEGSYLVLFAFLLPVLVGVAGLGTEGGLWLYSQQALQGAADSAAVSVAVLVSNNRSATSANILTQAEAIIYGVPPLGYGFASSGTNAVTVTLNQPPKSGNYTTNPDAFELILTRQQNPLFSSLWSSKSFNIVARSVGLAAIGCGVLALDPSAPGAVSLIAFAGVNLTGCPLFSDSSSSSSIELFLAEIHATGRGGTVGTVGDVSGFFDSISPTPTTDDKPITDPYSSVPLPPFTVPKNQAGCTGGGTFSSKTPAMPKNGAVLNPGVYCEGITLSGVNVTMNPGIYILYALNSSGTPLSMTNSKLTGNGGVTLVFTGSANPNTAMSVDAGSTISLTAPTAGPTVGMVMYGDRNMPVGTPYTFIFGAALNATGAVYLPTGNLTFAGVAGSTANCTLLIADTIKFVGIAGLQDECSGVGTFSIDSPGAVALVE